MLDCGHCSCCCRLPAKLSASSLIYIACCIHLATSPGVGSSTALVKSALGWAAIQQQSQVAALGIQGQSLNVAAGRAVGLSP